MDIGNARAITSQESELKFRLTADDVANIRARSILTPLSWRKEVLQSTYFDTSDHLLHKAGVSLRLRKSAHRIVQTLKYESPAFASLFLRREYEIRVPRPILDLDHVRRHCPARLAKHIDDKLKAVFCVDVERTNWTLHWNGSDIIASLDEGIIQAGGKRQPIRELEIELRHGAIADAFDLARALAKVACLEIATTSKAERGYRLRRGGTSTFWKPPAITLDADVAFEDAVRTNALHCISYFAANEALFSERHSAEGVHQMRVALRRLLSLMSLCKKWLPKMRKGKSRAEIKRAFRRLGEARDLDVAIEALNKSKQSDTGAILNGLCRDRKAAYRKVVELLCSRRFWARMIALLETIICGRNTNKQASACRRCEAPHSYYCVRHFDKTMEEAERIRPSIALE
ncbi:CYTH and CHAD domain-containing protein [Methylovirgula sp. 4M-Z18]|uniref:CYTH and CHAD domain-containing protein n=1 Tax=Methylovirgula sp. 4M-Z18 TaxID=2293567 RepID=UPI001313FE5D|nr:CYTH and CHAD domain-containing protein [Methylovirgula sp. 4M-Z18]